MATTFTVHIDWDRDGSFTGPPAGNQLLNGDFSSDEAHWQFWDAIVHSVSGGKLNVYRNGGTAAFYQEFDYRACAGDTVTIQFDVANPSGTDKTFDVMLRSADGYDGLISERFTVSAGAAETTRTITGTPGAAWDGPTRFEVSLVTDDNDPALTFDNISVTLTHNWDDITPYTRRVTTWAGFDQPGAAVAARGRCTLVLDNADRRFSPGNTEGPLYGKLLPRRAVRVRASNGASTWTLFRGTTESITPQAGALRADTCEIACVDGVTLLARQHIGVTHADSQAVDDAVADVVGAAYTPPATAYADNGDTLTHYGRSWQPEHTTALDALREICTAVYGRFYIARDGTATYITRGDRQNPSQAAAAVFGATYADRVLATQPGHLIGYWRLNESGGTAADDSSPYGHDGQASGVAWGADGIGDDATAAAFDGINDLVDLYSAGLSSAFDGAAGTLMIWARVADASVWTDSTTRRALRFQGDSGSNVVSVYRSTTDNLLAVVRYGGGDGLLHSLTGMDDTGWMCLAITWDEDADALRVFLNGAQQGSTRTGLGTWDASGLSSSQTVLGANADTGGQHWYGDLAHCAVWDVALNADELTDLAVV